MGGTLCKVPHNKYLKAVGKYELYIVCPSYTFLRHLFAEEISISQIFEHPALSSSIIHAELGGHDNRDEFTRHTEKLHIHTRLCQINIAGIIQDGGCWWNGLYGCGIQTEKQLSIPGPSWGFIWIAGSFQGNTTHIITYRAVPNGAKKMWFNTSSSRQNRQHFADQIFKWLLIMR